MSGTIQWVEYQVTYFKSTGKCYTSATMKIQAPVRLDDEDCVRAVDMQTAFDEIRRLHECVSPMPGLAGSWQDGYVLVDHPEHGFPRLFDFRKKS